MKQTDYSCFCLIEYDTITRTEWSELDGRINSVWWQLPLSSPPSGLLVREAQAA